MKYKVVIKNIKRFNKAVELSNELRSKGFKKVLIFEHNGKFGVELERFKTKKEAQSFIDESKLKHQLVIDYIY